MGLALEVGILSRLRQKDGEAFDTLKRQFDALNGYLEGVGLARHEEPEDCQAWSCSLPGAAGLHYLRRAAAHLDIRGDLPRPGGHGCEEDPVYLRYCELGGTLESGIVSRVLLNPKKRKGAFDHLILHEVGAGFYLPQPFRDVLFPDDSLGIDGGQVGSSVRLLEECQRLVQALEIPEDRLTSPDELAALASRQGEGKTVWERYAIEAHACACLVQACQRSIEQCAALVIKAGAC